MSNLLLLSISIQRRLIKVDVYCFELLQKMHPITVQSYQQKTPFLWVHQIYPSGFHLATAAFYLVSTDWHL